LGVDHCGDRERIVRVERLGALGIKERETPNR
jgi:hypothetical protein